MVLLLPRRLHLKTCKKYSDISYFLMFVTSFLFRAAMIHEIRRTGEDENRGINVFTTFLKNFKVICVYSFKQKAPRHYNNFYESRLCMNPNRILIIIIETAQYQIFLLQGMNAHARLSESGHGRSSLFATSEHGRGTLFATSRHERDTLFATSGHGRDTLFATSGHGRDATVGHEIFLD